MTDHSEAQQRAAEWFAIYDSLWTQETPEFLLALAPQLARDVQRLEEEKAELQSKVDDLEEAIGMSWDEYSQRIGRR